MTGEMPLSPRTAYQEWVEEQVEDFKESLSREDLLSLADQALAGLFDTDNEQYPLTEILLKDSVDALIFHRLRLPSYRQWLRSCHSDTSSRPEERTFTPPTEGRQAS